MYKNFLSCDWGTSSFRLRLVDSISEKIITESFSDDGIAAVFARWKNAGANESERVQFYLTIIQKHIGEIEKKSGGTNDVPVIVSGMASASIGMIELPYARLPFSLNGEGLETKKIKKTDSFAHDILIISGARTDDDVMRGEETQLVGCAGNETSGKQVFIFPGTHSKHITTINGKAIDVVTYMTGEFFELLLARSILSNSIEAGSVIAEKENQAAFAQAVKDSRAQNLLHSSFMVRTNQLLKRFSKTANYFYLSGLLIGTEINGLLKENINAVTIAGEKKLVSNYILTLKTLDADLHITTADAATSTVKGQAIIYRRMYP